MLSNQTRYDSVAIILHWVMATAILLMLASGTAMHYFDIPKSLKFNMYQWHKSLGLILLVAFFLRLFWRISHKPPLLPISMGKNEVQAAKAGHWLLYLFMIVMPLSGWVMVSSSVYGLPTIIFGLFQWPHLPHLSGNEIASNGSKVTHFYGAILLGVLILGHIGAVIMHYVFQKENILKRMWWSK